jgi:DUF917 family protein
VIWRGVRFLLHEMCLMKITASDIDDLALGAVFLATGGGGDPYLPTLIAKETLAQTGGVTLIDAQSLDDDAFVVPVGGVGAPTVSLELLPSVDEASKVLDRYEELVGRPISAVASFEIGGGNSLMPLMAAAVRGLPVVDGDGMGRAFPEAQMMSYAIAGVKPTPALAMDYAGNTAVFDTSDTTTYEHHIRAFAAAAGGMITVAEHPMSGAQIKASVIPSTVSFSLKLGRLLREQRGPIDDVMPALRSLFAESVYGSVHKIFAGKVSSKSTRTVGGYDVGDLSIEDFDNSQCVCSITIKNEYLVATVDDRPLAMVPETSTPINAERLHYGQRVAVLAVGAPLFYQRPDALAATEPRCFGIDLEYESLDALVNHQP